MIQMWQNGLMMGRLSECAAKELVKTGTYRWINDQAIDWIGRA